MKKILIITYKFPPYLGGGVIRVHNFVKYFPKFGMIPVVLTIKDKYHENKNGKDLLSEYDESVRIYKTWAFNTAGDSSFRQKIDGVKKKSFIFKCIEKVLKNPLTRKINRDKSILWIPIALYTALKIYKKEKFSFILVTGPPFGMFLATYLIYKLTKKSYFLDFRDEWVGNEYLCSKRNKFQYSFEKLLEHIVIKNSNKVLSTTEEKITCFREKYSDIPNDKYALLPNGYDGSLFSKLIRPKNSKKKMFTFIYTGTIAERRDPGFFFQAIKELFQEDKKYKKLIIIFFIGVIHNKHKDLAIQLGFGDNIVFEDMKSPQEIIKLLIKEADVLLLFQRKSEGGARAIPGKVYEYMAAQKPILCMDDGGATTNFLQSVGSTLCVDYEDVEKIKEKIKYIIGNYEEVNKKFRWDKELLNSFKREYLTGKLCDIINDSMRQNKV